MQLFEYDAHGLMIRLAEGTPALAHTYDDEDDTEQRLTVTFSAPMCMDATQPSEYELRLTKRQAEAFARGVLDQIANWPEA